MFDLLIAIVLTRVFWGYGADVGTGKWLSVFIYIAFYLASGYLGFIFFTSLVAAVPTAIVLMLISMVNDKKRVQAHKDRLEAENLMRAYRPKNAK